MHIHKSDSGVSGWMVSGLTRANMDSKRLDAIPSVKKQLEKTWNLQCFEGDTTTMTAAGTDTFNMLQKKSVPDALLVKSHSNLGRCAIQKSSG